MIEFDKEQYGFDDMDVLVTKALHLLGIPAHIKGHNYLRKAITITIKNPSAVDFITKSIYPDIAKMYATTPGRVSLAMYHAIEVAWSRGVNSPLRPELFPQETIKPTNCDFISKLAEYISELYNKN